MVSLVKLSSQNFDIFKELSSINFAQESYDKDFFEYYKKSGFLPKIFMKKFVRLFLYNGKFIGYLWYEVPIGFNIKILSLYLDINYIDVINKNTLHSFDDSILVYESIKTDYRDTLLSNLGFTILNTSLLMSIELDSYNIDVELQRIYEKLLIIDKRNNFPTLYSNQNINAPYITFDKIQTKNDIITRCHIQNKIFNETNRIPIQLEDIENDINQDYYISDLSYFIKLNGTAIGYGQVIFSRGMYTIVNFGVIDEYRGFGFGKLLLNYLIKKAKKTNIKKLFLRVDQNNINAINLYKWIGFTTKHTINKWERR